ncbi:hypothetical protein FHS43_006234 [Streptosporangium becharense]|uniref:Uncharacterized protein n=1 Tax=Streptosporangium becharense TaxID=1816182 RepID=A0A7W9IGH6_9ACTN|nr:hypothetical protein [Streptosporangium becharense]MBB2914922.1 hypothetical protein [Streptosporangium becharense]MBB5820267.1 hypothetical protein [Streptosporangium becharense]
MTHVIRYRELPKDVAVQIGKQEHGITVIVVNSTLPHDEQRAAVAAALRPDRPLGALPLPVLLLTAERLRDLLWAPVVTTATSTAAAVSICRAVILGAPEPRPGDRPPPVAVAPAEAAPTAQSTRRPSPTIRSPRRIPVSPAPDAGRSSPSSPGRWPQPSPPPDSRPTTSAPSPHAEPTTSAPTQRAEPTMTPSPRTTSTAELPPETSDQPAQQPAEPSAHPSSDTPEADKPLENITAETREAVGEVAGSLRDTVQSTVEDVEGVLGGVTGVLLPSR